MRKVCGGGGGRLDGGRGGGEGGGGEVVRKVGSEGKGRGRETDEVFGGEFGDGFVFLGD